MTDVYVLPEKSRFALGAFYLTASVDGTISPEDIADALARHAQSDWGEVCEEDKASNDEALIEGGRLLSAYRDRNGTRFWIITESDRSATTVLLPEDY